MERADGVLADRSKKVRGKKLQMSLNLSWIRKKMKEMTGRLGKVRKVNQLEILIRSLNRSCECYFNNGA